MLIYYAHHTRIYIKQISDKTISKYILHFLINKKKIASRFFCWPNLIRPRILSINSSKSCMQKAKKKSKKNNKLI